MLRLLPIRPLVTLILLFAVSTDARAQSIAPVGSEATLDVATWNIEWFGSSSSNQGPSDVHRQFDLVRSIIEQAEIDVWGVQEISNPAMFNALLDSLGEAYGGSLATYSQQQKIGFIYRTDVIAPKGAISHFLTNYEWEFGGRAPLRMVAEVTLPDTTFEATFITAHMKAMSDVASYGRRLEASQRLKNQLDFLYATDAVIVLADFNDRLTTSITSGRDTPYQNFLDDASSYRFVTLEAEERGEVSFLGSQRSIIDHILISDEWFDAYVEDSARPWSELPRTFIGYTSTTSDHLPVYARFDFTRGTSADRPSARAEASLSAPYPNPVSGEVRFSYTLERGGDVMVDVYDLRGRLVARIERGYHSAGRYDVEWSPADLAPGVYLLRLEAGGKSATRTIGIVR